jgi:ubiquinone/menaquinone biosynthesis C-methylase UbiE
MGVKEHYDKHLGNFYAWMSGHYRQGVKDFTGFLEEHRLKPAGTGIAVDLGAGHGIQSVALAKKGFTVEAIDFNDQLLKLLRKRADRYDIHVVKDDLRNFASYCSNKPELIVCWGDTITHLDDWKSITDLLLECLRVLAPKGRLVLGFRDYSTPLHDTNRFIPVKSDNKRILTCFIEYFESKVRVTDIFHQRKGGEWTQTISAYEKVRINPQQLLNFLRKHGMKIVFEQINRGLVQVIAEKA